MGRKKCNKVYEKQKKWKKCLEDKWERESERKTSHLWGEHFYTSFIVAVVMLCYDSQSSPMRIIFPSPQNRDRNLLSESQSVNLFILPLLWERERERSKVSNNPISVNPPNLSNVPLPLQIIGYKPLKTGRKRRTFASLLRVWILGREFSEKEKEKKKAKVWLMKFWRDLPSSSLSLSSVLFCFDHSSKRP